MHGVPPDLPLGRFVGQELNLIGLGRFQTQFHFAGTGRIYAESRWELRGPAGDLVDAACDHVGRDCYRVHQIIDVPVRSVSVDAPRSFTLVFETGHTLTIYDDSDRYECFSVHFDGEPSYYV